MLSVVLAGAMFALRPVVVVLSLFLTVAQKIVTLPMATTLWMNGVLFRPLNTPLLRRRWRVFCRNRRALWALCCFAPLWGGSLAAEWLANDRPLVVFYNKKLYFPVLAHYPECVFGGDFEIETCYTDPYIQEQIQQKGWALWPLIPFGAHTVDASGSAPQPPSLQHWLGTDDQGRDICARLLYGTRASLLFALALATASSILALIIGGIQGYYGGLVDLIGQRLVEIWAGLPMFYGLILLSSFVEPSFLLLLVFMSAFVWLRLVGIVRAEFLRARALDYVRAAHALGVGPWRVMARHILPNAMVAVLTMMPFIINNGITLLTSLDFLGFGLPPGSPSLGELVAQGKNNLHAPWLGITVFVYMSYLLSLLVFIGEGVRDAFDPRREDVEVTR